MLNRLREVRNAREWSQARLIHEIEKYARQHTLDVGSTASLRVYVSEWENAKRSISERYAQILRPVLGVTDEELFGRHAPAAPPPAVGGYDELISRIDSARSVSLTMVKTFMDQTELLRTVDRQMGAASLVDQMTGHLATLEDALTFAVLPETRRPVALALAGAATLAAWQALDAGGVERAWRHYELGKRAAQEADEPMYLAHATAEQAYVLNDAGRPEMAVQLVREAQRLGGDQMSPRLQAWLYAAEAELCAKAGMPDDCRRALDRADAVLPTGSEARDPDMLSIFLNRGHLARWRGNALALLGDDDALGSLYTALDEADPTFVRATSGLRCDLAQAHLARDEHAQAQEHMQQARLLANRTGSVRYRRRVEQLMQRL
ncbi:helix-turn-helix transcriptional regulator [Streptomyces formicae]|uniref:XRE family transcriptional regulator n=2 Tax=Streptomyces formicae TaxID=1616117 RepID=A0ABY3WVZ3_9ACTN|nr:helix-turn-helix transcriptional regulator [Streptomyces formicae]UNM15472.1 XRE family transcriptional regulator [Streptomyces formicae]UNM16928.1 XRE family transcriptional regulator [Streptomyces formicae]UNM16949.1 XRE family transcriptional regulator [Streptomyces formicae]